MAGAENRLDAQLCQALNEAIGRSGAACRIQTLDAVGGGSISRTVVARSGDTRWFVKLDSAERHAMFVAEADGLSALAACPALRVPRVVADGVSGRQAYLVMEYLQLRPIHERRAASSAGHALAALHRITGTEFGWPRANFIGSTPQLNAGERTWPLFFARQRLLPQLALAARQRHPARLVADGERLAERLPALFVDYRPAISLVHGDLWHGNAALDETQTLALFDPAVYYGDRETDLAMSELFGGFPASFYAAYRDAWPLADGYEQRKTLYNLYHILNHLNLFGGAYRHQAERMIGQLLAEIG
jgi:fructosamine-3-kinase